MFMGCIAKYVGKYLVWTVSIPCEEGEGPAGLENGKKLPTVKLTQASLQRVGVMETNMELLTRAARF